MSCSAARCNDRDDGERGQSRSILTRLPRAAHESSGRARTVSEVYSVLSARYAGAANSQATRSAMASVGDIPAGAALASAGSPDAPSDNAAYLSSFPDVRSATPVTMAFASPAASTSPSNDPVFRTLFQPGDRTQPVSSAVHELWGNSSSLTSVGTASVASATSPLARTPVLRAPQPLDLFSDRNGIFSS